MSDPESNTAPVAPKKKGMKPWMIAVIAIVVVVIVVAAAVMSGLFENDDSSTMDSIKERKTLIMATEATFLPFEYYDVDNETIVGFDIDIANKIAENISAELGVQVDLEVRDVAFNTIPAMLKNKQIDMSLSGMTITEERNKSVLFSTPYYFMEAGLGMLVRADYNDINDNITTLVGKNIVVNTGTTSEIWVQKNLIDTGLIDQGDVKSLPTIANCVSDVQIGQSDVFIIDKPTCEAYVETTDGAVKVAGVIPSFEPYGVAMNLDSADLKAIVDQVITTMLNNGEMTQLREKWGLV
jgi:ABC-type amino acid transport substrate-binding protein